MYQQLPAGLGQPGVAVPAGAYLATLLFKAGPDAAGSFTIDVRRGRPAENRSVLFATAAGALVEIRHVQPAHIHVQPRR